jgi:pentatricopeptide repeat protein
MLRGLGSINKHRYYLKYVLLPTREKLLLPSLVAIHVVDVNLRSFHNTRETLDLPPGHNSTAQENTLSTTRYKSFQHILTHGSLPSHRNRLPSSQEIQNDPVLSLFFRDPIRVRMLAEAFARSSHPYRAHRVFSLANERGCRLLPNLYECVAFHLAKAKKWYLIPSLVSLAKSHTGKSTLRLLNWRARALVEEEHYALLEDILDQFDREDLKPDRRTFHLLIRGHLLNRNLQRAKETMQRMKTAGHAIDSSTYAMIVSAYRSLGPDAEVLAKAFMALEDRKSRSNGFILNSILRLMLDAHNAPEALRTLSLFDSRLLDPDMVASSASKSRRNIPSTLDAVSSRNETSARTGKIIPNTATFTMLIRRMANRKDLPRALRIFSKMKADGISVGSGTVAALVHAHFAAGDPNGAINLVASMCDVHSTHLAPFGIQPSPDEPLSLQTKVPLTVDICNALLQGFLESRGLPSIMIVIRFMISATIVPDGRTIEILIAHIESLGVLRPRQLVRLFRYLSSTATRPTLRHLHIILKAIMRRQKYSLHKSGWMVHASRLSHRVLSRSRTPTHDNPSFYPMLGFKLPKRPPYRSLVRPIMQSLLSRRVRNDRATLALRIRHEAVVEADLQTARKTFHQMVAHGMHPNEYHFSALMEGFALVGNLDGARRVMNAAIRAGVEINPVMFTILIVGHARQGQPDLAMRTFQDMINAGIRPDPPAIDAVSSAYYIARARRKARRTLLDLWPFVQRFPPQLYGASLKQLADEMRALKSQSGDRLPLTKSQKLHIYRRIKRLKKRWWDAFPSTRTKVKASPWLLRNGDRLPRDQGDHVRDNNHTSTSYVCMIYICRVRREHHFPEHACTKEM